MSTILVKDHNYFDCADNSLYIYNSLYNYLYNYICLYNCNKSGPEITQRS